MSRATIAAAAPVSSPKSDSNPLAKTVYFATGSPELALQDIERLGLATNGIGLRVVSPAVGCARLRANPALNKSGLIAYSHGRAVLVWLRLMAFLGFARHTDVICLNTPQNYRLLKLLAFSLRGRGRFSTGEGQTPEVSVLGMARLSWHNYWIRNEARFDEKPILIIGSGSSRSLRLIAAKLRDRYPGQKLTACLPTSLAAALPGVFDDILAIPSSRGSALRTATQLWKQRKNFKAAVIPCTNEFNRWMKLVSLLTPLRRKKIYNELGDSFELARIQSGVRHLQWRFLKTDRKLAWPVAVIGSASGHYLDKIVVSVRRSFPGSEVHGWLGPLQTASAGHLFDVVHPLPTTSASITTAVRLLARGRRYRNWIIPCTDEPFRWLKCLAFCMPLRSRMLYNEVGDGFALRSAATVWEHVCWRLRYKFTIQFLSGSSDSTLLQRLVHVPAYALRLAAAGPLLFRATRPRKHGVQTPKIVALFVLGDGDSDATLPTAVSDTNGIVLSVERVPPEADIMDVLVQSAKSSTADYICILDGKCRVSSSGWLEQLLEPFDETVAQVGPELKLEGTPDVYQGALFDGRGGVIWNTNSAARYHAREQWLEVAALSSLCVVVRRQALLSVAADYKRLRSRCGRKSDDAMGELGRLFAINGWISICNTNVSAFYPLKTRADQLQFSTAT
jgi:hypothetical protein